jgi:hypothetical protein
LETIRKPTLLYPIIPTAKGSLLFLPTVAICASEFPRLPLITRWVDKPFGFFVLYLDGNHNSPWMEAEG